MFFRALFRFINWIGLRQSFTLLLLWLALSSAIWTLDDLISSLTVGLLALPALMGLLLGWLLAAARPISDRLAGGLLSILGIELAIVQNSAVETIFLRLARAGGLAAGQLWQSQLPSIEPIYSALSELQTALLTLATRLYIWATAILSGNSAFDPVAGAIAWSLALWTIAAWAGWVSHRHNKPLVALLPGGALLATVLAYHPSRAANLLPLVAVLLLLLGISRYTTLQQAWRCKGIDVTPTLQTELMFAIIPVSALLLLLASLTPSISIWRIMQSIQQSVSAPDDPVEPVAQALGLELGESDLRKQSPGLFAPGLPRRHLLGSGPELSEQLALIVTVSHTTTSSTQQAPRYYWRGLNFDRYTGRGWSTNQTRQIDYEAGQVALSPAEIPNQQVLHQQVQAVGRPAGLLHAAGTPISADQPYSINWRDPGDPFALSIQANTYRVRSLLPQVEGPQTLQAAGTNYPPEIRFRYLRLPSKLPGRVRALARDLTATGPTAYDRAKAIESYLRTFPYSLNLPEPPRGRDLVDYFLFDLQQGYCDYYASSMVVLARAAGLPARMAVGYASGVFDPATGRYLVTEADAHSWPEIYFPDYGWIPFEPTAAQPVSSQSGSIPEAPTPQTSIPESGPTTITNPGDALAWTWLGRLLAGGGLTVLTLLLVAAAGDAIDYWRLGRMTPAVAVGTLYRRLLAAGQRLAVPGQPGDTPNEYAAEFGVRLQTLLQTQTQGEQLAAATTEEIRQLTALYVQNTYSRNVLAPASRTRAIQSWRRLRGRLWLLWLARLWQRPK